MKNKENIIILLLLICLGVGIFLLINKKKIFSSISFASSEITLKVGEEKELDIITKNIDKENISWKSSNSDIVTVSDGKVKGLMKGSTTITAIIDINKKEATIVVKVEDVEPESIKFNEKSINLIVGDSINLNYVILPNNVTNKEVTWEISDNEIIENNNGIIKGLKEGTVTITIKTVNGYSDTCNVSVSRREIPIEKINFDKTSYSVYVNESITINTEIIPSDATDKKIKWESSDNEIATVNDGVVMGLKKGISVIRVSDSSGTVTNQVTVEVFNRITEINPKEITIIGDSRMEGLCGYKWYKEEGGTCVAKSGMGYRWLNSTAISEVNRLSPDKKKYIVTNLGVNDLGSINSYIAKYQELVSGSWKDYHIFLLSVNPTSGTRDNLNSNIVKFNTKLKEGLNGYANVTYCDSYSYLKKNGFKSGDGLHYGESTSKVIYEQIKKCIYDYYNE